MKELFNREKKILINSFELAKVQKGAKKDARKIATDKVNQFYEITNYDMKKVISSWISVCQSYEKITFDLVLSWQENKNL
jgi:hypothetical protein